MAIKVCRACHIITINKLRIVLHLRATVVAAVASALAVAAAADVFDNVAANSRAPTGSARIVRSADLRLYL